jgi:hypothetical protein
MSHPLRPPAAVPALALVPFEQWDAPTATALSVALQLASEVRGVLVATGEEDDASMARRWEHDVQAPITSSGRSPPRLEVVPSPYRTIVGPLEAYVRRTLDEVSGRLVVVVLPEVLARRGPRTLFEASRVKLLDTLLLLGGAPHLVLVTVPYYLDATAPRNEL